MKRETLFSKQRELPDLIPKGWTVVPDEIKHRETLPETRKARETLPDAGKRRESLPDPDTDFPPTPKLDAFLEKIGKRIQYKITISMAPAHNKHVLGQKDVTVTAGDMEGRNLASSWIVLNRRTKQLDEEYFAGNPAFAQRFGMRYKN